MHTNEGPKWSYYMASLNRDNTSGENTVQNGERDCSGSTALIIQHTLHPFKALPLSDSFSLEHTHFPLFNLPHLSLVSVGAHAWSQLRPAMLAVHPSALTLLFRIYVRVANARLVPRRIKLISLFTASLFVTYE